MAKSKLIVFLLFSLMSIHFVGQNTAQHAYLFDKFENGMVIFESGQETDGLFNYDMIREKFIFLSNNEKLELANPNRVDCIIINERKFKHVGNGVFYELVETYQMPFYIRWKLKAVPQEMTGGYGSAPKSSSAKQVSKFETSHSVVELNTGKKVSTELNNSYYLNIDGKLRKFDSAKSLSKLFKNHEQKIKDYSKQKKIDYKDINDVILMVNYCAKFVDK